MKEKIFQKLKTKYSALGLGDEILMAHAEMLAAVGFVSENNMDSVVDAQKGFLEGLQKANDKRATDAAKTAKENAKKEFEEEQAKREAEARKLADAEKAAREAKEKAEKEAAEKAAKEEEERKRLEEMKKNNDIPQYAKDMQEEYLKKLQEERRKADEDRNAFKEMLEKMQQSNKQLSEQMQQQIEANKSLNDALTAMKTEATKKARHEGIINKAKELGIPQSRIDEGFAITDDMDMDAITNHLNVVAANYKALNLSGHKGFGMEFDKSEASEEEIKAIAETMVKH